MSGLKIPYLKQLTSAGSMDAAELLMSNGALIRIDKINWADFPAIIDTSAYTGYSNDYLWIHYVVRNETIRAVCRQDQEPVWQDSCVEFFLKQGDNYRNFEFNCLGVCLSANGPGRNGREPLATESLSRILRFPSLKIESITNENVVSDWSLTVAIPLPLIGIKAGERFWANFYKCGDETKAPHYISWSPIVTSSPDFHRPEYFALAELEQ